MVGLTGLYTFQFPPRLLPDPHGHTCLPFTYCIHLLITCRVVTLRCCIRLVDLVYLRLFCTLRLDTHRRRCTHTPGYGCSSIPHLFAPPIVPALPLIPQCLVDPDYRRSTLPGRTLVLPDSVRIQPLRITLPPFPASGCTQFGCYVPVLPCSVTFWIPLPFEPYLLRCVDPDPPPTPRSFVYCCLPVERLIVAQHTTFPRSLHTLQFLVTLPPRSSLFFTVPITHTGCCPHIRPRLFGWFGLLHSPHGLPVTTPHLRRCCRMTFPDGLPGWTLPLQRCRLTIADLLV